MWLIFISLLFTSFVVNSEDRIKKDSLISKIRTYRQTFVKSHDVDSEKYFYKSFKNYVYEGNNYSLARLKATSPKSYGGNLIGAIFKNNSSGMPKKLIFYHDISSSNTTNQFKKVANFKVTYSINISHYSTYSNVSRNLNEKFRLRFKDSIKIIKYSYQEKRKGEKVSSQSCLISFSKSHIQFSASIKNNYGKETDCCRPIKDSINFNLISRGQSRLLYDENVHFGFGNITSDSSYHFTFFPNTDYRYFKVFKIPRNYIKDIGCCFIQNDFQKIKNKIRIDQSDSASISLKGSGKHSIIYGKLTGTKNQDIPIFFIKDFKTINIGNGWPKLEKVSSYCSSIRDIFTFQF